MTSTIVEEDPLIAALPPTTDYITYLTLLEYQLNASNLHTLTRLLADDDGTLAQEIGWDLVKLVLPLSDHAPQAASQCLEIVARRGNPREVVLRIAEELETLASQDGDEESNPDQIFQSDLDDDELPTFAGEADRIHLGDLTLEGMPPPTTIRAQPAAVAQAGNGDNQTPSVGTSKLQIMMSMLSILHPRIKTQHPSRFLAMSLPAALRAYRRTGDYPASTTAFLSFLGKLSGKQRPDLPPRASVNNILAMSASNASGETEGMSAPLPDPEAQNETATSTEVSSQEASIVRRLLQAVLLEVLEEYVQSLGVGEPRQMSWASRLREKFEPGKILPGKETVTQKWHTDADLEERDLVVGRIVRLSKDLEINMDDVSRSLLRVEGSVLGEPETQPSAESADSPPDYPMSPEDIPFSKYGLILLLAAHNMQVALRGLPNQVDEATTMKVFPSLSHLFRTLEDPSEHPALRKSPPPGILDAALALLYSSAFHAQLGSEAELRSSFVPLMLLLSTLCSDNPDPEIRDSTHAIATKLFHQCPDTSLKILAVKSIIQTTPAANMQAAAVNWLKDEFLASSAPTTTSSAAEVTTTTTTFSTPDEGYHNITSPVSNLLRPTILTTDHELASLLFHPTGPAQDLVDTLPFHISTLNLLTVLFSNSSPHRRLLIATEEETLLPEFKHMISTLATQRASLDTADTSAQQQQQQQQQKQQIEDALELWTLDNALERAGRAVAAQEKDAGTPHNSTSLARR